MIQRTFQHIPGVGPWREKDLWARGIRTWDDFPLEGAPTCISKKVDLLARTRIEQARDALQRKDLRFLAELIPGREHWRLYNQFAEECALKRMVQSPRPQPWSACSTGQAFMSSCAVEI